MDKLQRLLFRIWRKLFRRFDRYLYVYDLSQMPDGGGWTTEVGYPWKIVKIDTSNAELLDEMDGIKPRFRRAFDGMLKAGEVGMFLLADGHVFSHMWFVVNHGPGIIDRGYLRVYPGEAYAHHLRAYPQPDERHPAHVLAMQMKRFQASFRREVGLEDIRVLKTSVLIKNRPAVAFVWGNWRAHRRGQCAMDHHGHELPSYKTE